MGESAFAGRETKVLKLYWVARIGPKKVLQTPSKPASYLHALDLQKSVRNFVNPRWEGALVQAETQSAKILLAC